MTPSKNPYDSFVAVFDGIEGVVNAVAVCFLVALALITFFEVFSRYVLSVSHAAADDMERYLLINGVLLAAAGAYRRNAHVRVELVLGLVPAPVRRVMLGLTDVLGLVLCAFMTWQGFLYDQRLYVGHMVSTSSFAAPLFVAALGLPIGFGLLTLVFAEHLVRVVAGDPRSDPVFMRERSDPEAQIHA